MCRHLNDMLWRYFRRVFFGLILVALVAGGFISLPDHRVALAQSGLTQPAAPAPQVIGEVKHDTSIPLREIQIPTSAVQGVQQQPSPLKIPRLNLDGAATAARIDAALQTKTSNETMPTPGFNFNGVNNLYSLLPPDPNGDIGLSHYVQWVNVALAVWEIDRLAGTQTLVYGPVAGNTLWSGFGGPCSYRNDGDPIVLYDALADRWFASQFALDDSTDPSQKNGPYFQCAAVSTTGDPTGAWNRYQFNFSNTLMNDYSKFGVWPDGYYMSTNQYNGGISWAGQGVAVLERDKMLAGQAARMVYFNMYPVDSSLGAMLPSDLDGQAPPTGAPNPYMQFDDNYPIDQLQIWHFHVDWVTPSNSSFTKSAALAVAAFDSNMCGWARNCIPQKSTSSGLDAISDRLMYRLQYRNFGAYQTLVTNHTVDVDGTDHAGIRWYEIRDNGGGWQVYQQATYAPDAKHRWMGSAAMDRAGNLAVGYSVSSSLDYPSIRYAGRLNSDPLDELAQSEQTLYAGNGSQTSTYYRWGDYSMLAVDPVDGCTFWYTNEYYPSTSSSGWYTRIGSFVFPSCLEAGNIAGIASDKDTSLPLEGVQVQAVHAGSGALYQTMTDAQGAYQFTDLPVGLYTLTASLPGYVLLVTADVLVSVNTTTTQDLVLQPNPYKIDFPLIWKQIAP